MFPELTADNMQSVAGAIQNAGANRL
jgi:hypothetical protein